jgi:hypothetical protein
MNQSAKVHSTEAIRDFRIALTNFAEDARNALSSVEMEIRRTRDWLTRDQMMYWQTAVKRGNEHVSMARTELHRRRLSQQNSDVISDTEQKENLRAAQRRLEEAEAKVKKVKSWIPVLEHAIADYHSASQPLGDRLTGSLVNSLTLLDRMLASLDAYLTLAPPSTPVVAPGAEAGAPSASATTTAPPGGEPPQPSAGAGEGTDQETPAEPVPPPEPEGEPAGEKAS